MQHGIIPSRALYIDTATGHELPHENYLKHQAEIDLQALSVFAATGFFLENDTHYKTIKTLPPATEYTHNPDGTLTVGNTYFHWHYTPRQLSLKQATEEFAHLFEKTCQTLTADTSVVLPLSGGLDSRTLAAALKKHPAVQSYSYEFDGGEPETSFSRQIAQAESFPFSAYKISQGYLWKVIDDLACTNLCSSEFTHPRQMEHIHLTSALGQTFVLGHWGDVLFDGMGVPDDLSFDGQVEVLYKKVLKKGGAMLGKALWQHWGLSGHFDEYLKERLSNMHQAIRIENANARVRAFKSMYWATRWTSSNLTIFNKNNRIALPYYHNDMCRFICTLPEHLLADRQIQIEYLKWKAPELARIKRQGYGLDLYHFQDFYKWHKLPNRLALKLNRLLAGSTRIKRNWELQFLGRQNETELQAHLQNPAFNTWINSELIHQTLSAFRADGVAGSHPLSILLTLALFHKHHFQQP